MLPASQCEQYYFAGNAHVPLTIREVYVEQQRGSMRNGKTHLSPTSLREMDTLMYRRGISSHLDLTRSTGSNQSLRFHMMLLAPDGARQFYPCHTVLTGCHKRLYIHTCVEADECLRHVVAWGSISHMSSRIMVQVGKNSKVHPVCT